MILTIDDVIFIALSGDYLSAKVRLFFGKTIVFQFFPTLFLFFLDPGDTNPPQSWATVGDCMMNVILRHIKIMQHNFKNFVP